MYWLSVLLEAEMILQHFLEIKTAKLLLNAAVSLGKLTNSSKKFVRHMVTVSMRLYTGVQLKLLSSRLIYRRKNNYEIK